MPRSCTMTPAGPLTPDCCLGSKISHAGHAAVEPMCVRACVRDKTTAGAQQLCSSGSASSPGGSAGVRSRACRSLLAADLLCSLNCLAASEPQDCPCRLRPQPLTTGSPPPRTNAELCVLASVQTSLVQEGSRCMKVQPQLGLGH